MVLWFISSVVWPHFCRRQTNLSSVILWKHVTRTLNVATQKDNGSGCIMLSPLKNGIALAASLPIILILCVSVYPYVDIYTSPI